MAARKYDRSEYYVHGSAVRKRQALHRESRLYAAQSNAAPEISRRPAREMPGKRKEQSRNRKKKAAAKATPSPAWDFKSLLFVVAILAAALGMCVSYLQAQESVTAMDKQIATLESEILTLKNQNDAEYSKIGNSTDLSHIYDVAVNELGMVHARNNQVIPYESKKSNSVRQYGDIPE